LVIPFVKVIAPELLIVLFVSQDVVAFPRAGWTTNNVWLQLRMVAGRWVLLLNRKKRMITS
jgi:hypothetical protein